MKIPPCPLVKSCKMDESERNVRPVLTVALVFLWWPFINGMVYYFRTSENAGGTALVVTTDIRDPDHVQRL